MADFISVDTTHSLDSELANSNIKEGEPAVRASGGGVDPLDVTNDVDIDHIVVHQRTGDHNLRYDTDYQSYSELYTYKPAGNKPDEDYDDRVPLRPLAEHDVVRTIAVEDTGETEPTFSENELVGFVDLGNGPRLVPDEYSTGGTTYSEDAAGDFVAFGYVDKLPDHKTQRSGYGELIPVRVADDV